MQAISDMPGKIQGSPVDMRIHSFKRAAANPDVCPSETQVDQAASFCCLVQHELANRLSTRLSFQTRSHGNVTHK